MLANDKEIERKIISKYKTIYSFCCNARVSQSIATDQKQTSASYLCIKTKHKVDKINSLINTREVGTGQIFSLNLCTAFEL